MYIYLFKYARLCVRVCACARVFKIKHKIIYIARPLCISSSKYDSVPVGFTMYFRKHTRGRFNFCLIIRGKIPRF